MKKLLALLFFIPALAQAAEVKTLSVFNKTWDGKAIEYPKGAPEITAIKLTIPPGDKMPFHCHPSLTIGFVISGTLMVEKPSGEKHEFKAGDTIAEVVNEWHRGTNPSKTENTELLGFYVGQKGVKNTIMQSADNKDACK